MWIFEVLSCTAQFVLFSCKISLEQFVLQYWENEMKSCSQIMKGKHTTEMDALQEKTHKGKGEHGKDPVIRIKWESKSLWLLSIYHNLKRIGLNVRQPGWIRSALPAGGSLLFWHVPSLQNSLNNQPVNDIVGLSDHASSGSGFYFLFFFCFLFYFFWGGGDKSNQRNKLKLFSLWRHGWMDGKYKMNFADLAVRIVIWPWKNPLNYSVNVEPSVFT